MAALFSGLKTVRFLLRDEDDSGDSHITCKTAALASLVASASHLFQFILLLVNLPSSNTSLEPFGSY